MAFVTNLSAGNFVASGAYISPAPPSLIVPVGNSNNQLAVVGCFTRGAVGQPIFVSTAGTGSAAPIFAAVGAGTTLPFSGTRAAISAMPEITEFILIRATDGSELSAVSSFLGTDGNPLWILVDDDAGTNGNGMTQRLDLVASDVNTSPIFQLTVTYPFGTTQSLGGIVGYATPGAGLDVPTLIDSVVARVNGALANTQGSAYVTASAGTGTAPPTLATVFTSSGGSDGVANMTGAMLEGVPSGSGGTGMYALSGTPFGGLVFAGNSDLSISQNAAAFCAARGGIAYMSLPSSLTLEQQQALQNANNVVTNRVRLCADWDYVQDVASGQQLLVDPAPAIAAIDVSQSPWVDPSNKPYTGKLGILSTERTSVNPVDPQGEGAQRQASGIVWLTKSMPRGGNFLGLPHGVCSDGSNVTDTRMFDYVASKALGVLGKFVGEGQTPLPVGGPDLDRTRTQAKAALNSAFQPDINPNDPHLAAISITSDNTNTGISQGFMQFDINAVTLAGVKFALGLLAVGTTVQIISADAVTAAAAAA